MMTWIVDAWLWLLAMGVLILFSALFSGSEAALFSLQQRGRRKLARAGVGGAIAARLLENPERLLSAILFWNLMINMIYFAIAAIIGGKLENDPDQGRSAAIVFTIASLLLIIFLSEMLPKSLAVLAPLRLSVVVAPPLSLAVRIVGPVLPIVRQVNLAVSRLIWPTFRPEPEIDLGDIERAIELGTDDAVLLKRERQAMQSLISMSETRVAEWMRPRSKLVMIPRMHDVDGELQRSMIADGPPAGGYVMLTDSSGMVSGAVGVQMIRPSQFDDLTDAAEQVVYVPWAAHVSQVLDTLFEEDRAVAVVVNEFGEMVGALSIDEILQRVLAPDQAHGGGVGETRIQELGSGRYRVKGTISVRELANRLEIETPGDSIATVAGFIQHHNERLPRPGDQAVMGNFRLTVLEESTDGSVWIEVSSHRKEPQR